MNGPQTTTLLETETDLESFAGVVSGDEGPWGAVLTVARATDDDHVAAVTATVRPVGTGDGGMTAVEGSGWGMDDGSELLSRFGAFSAAAIEGLERA